MTDEVEAIRMVGHALARLPDAAARVRVLRWAFERFQIDTSVMVPAAVSQVVAENVKSLDPTLSMEGLHELFPVKRKTGEALPPDDDSLTLESDAAAGGELVAHVARPIPHVEESPQAGSMLHSFVSDFQRLADDCQTVFAAPVPARQ
ncbi:MAG: hypothetical protein AUF76_12715 [Acidobacteria bacterium 13_1_20CM_2_65_9]|nr:MAG: hypothetical protein AUF76_12715 [Acidobacteria bacterium 13_1_20CM_2_65_9]